VLFTTGFSLTNGNTESITLNFSGISVTADLPLYQLVTLKWVRNLAYISLALEADKAKAPVQSSDVHMNTFFITVRTSIV